MSEDEHLDGLVEAARAGGTWAFGRLWELLSPVVAGYLRGRGVRDVDDVTSQVFLSAFQGIGGFTGDGAAFRRWLFTIAHHRGVDDVRATVRRAPEVAYEPQDDPRTSPSAESDALTALSSDDVSALLDVLPCDQRHVLLLRVVGDMSVDDAAVVLERSPEAVRQLQHRALNRLRRHLAEKGSGPAVTQQRPETIAESR